MKHTMIIVEFSMLIWLLPLSAFGSDPGNKVKRNMVPTDETVARHALGRADLAERMGLCFQDQAANLRKMATELLHAKTPKEKDRYRNSLQAAHQALTDCLDLYKNWCAKKCSPLPPADISGMVSESSSHQRKGIVRSKIIAVDNGSIQDNDSGSGTRAMRLELGMGIKGKDLQLRHCYGKALMRDPDLSGMAAYRLVFGPDGQVFKAQLLSTTLANLSLARCALAPLGELHLSAKKIPDKATAVIRLVFSTVP